MKEIWKDIEGYEGIYQVSNKGRVKSLKRKICSNSNNHKYNTLSEKLLKLSGGGKYIQVILCKDGKTSAKLVHRLVAQAFIPNPENFSEVNHIDEDKTNNCIENLEWCDRLYNCNFGTRNERRAKSKSKSVMCLETGEVFSSAKEAQEKTGIFASAIGACARHKKHYYTAGSFHWKYV